MRWHPSGEVLVSTSYDDSIKLWIDAHDEYVCAQTLSGVYHSECTYYCTATLLRGRIQFKAELPTNAASCPCWHACSQIQDSLLGLQSYSMSNFAAKMDKKFMTALKTQAAAYSQIGVHANLYHSCITMHQALAADTHQQYGRPPSHTMAQPWSPVVMTDPCASGTANLPQVGNLL